MTKGRTRQSPDAIVYRLMQAEDVPDVLTLMTQSRFPVSSLVSKSIYSALCLDALSDERVVIAVATEEKQVAGFLLVIIDWTSYWKSFAMHHPILGLQIGWKRMNRKRESADMWNRLPQADKNNIMRIASARPSGKSWYDSSPAIAKVAFIYVDPLFRGRKLAEELYLYLMKILAKSGVSRIDAKVDLTNRRAMPLHISVGYRLERDGNSLFATKDLSK